MGGLLSAPSWNDFGILPVGREFSMLPRWSCQNGPGNSVSRYLTRRLRTAARRRVAAPTWLGIAERLETGFDRIPMLRIPSREYSPRRKPREQSTEDAEHSIAKIQDGTEPTYHSRKRATWRYLGISRRNVSFGLVRNSRKRMVRALYSNHRLLSTGPEEMLCGQFVDTGLTYPHGQRPVVGENRWLRFLYRGHRGYLRRAA
jgi:hypothetical protein